MTRQPSKRPPRPTIELQHRVLTLPPRTYPRSSRQENGVWIHTYTCVPRPGETNLPPTTLADLPLQVEDKARAVVRLVGGDVQVGDFSTSEQIDQLLADGRLEIEPLSTELYRQEQDRVLDLVAPNRNSPMPEQWLKTAVRVSRVMNDREVEAVREVLSGATIEQSPPFDTGELTPSYVRDAPADWPKDEDIPLELERLFGSEYGRSALEFGVSSGEDLYSQEELDKMIGGARAWPIPSLIGSLFASPSYQSIGHSLEHYIQTQTGLPFVVSKTSGYGGVGAYQHLHTGAGLVLRESSPNCVFLEIYGKLVGAKGVPSTDRLFAEHLARETWKLGKLAVPDGPMAFRIRSATLANIAHPGIGVPYYE